MTCPRCRFVLIPDDGRMVCYGCTRELGRLVPGEEEVGYQRWCATCGEWWPLSSEWWYLHTHERGDRYGDSVHDSPGATIRCLACKRENTRASKRRAA